jgi:hypothetical protein
MFGKYNGFVSKARVSAFMYFLVIAIILDKTICDTLLKHSFVAFLPVRPE